MNISKRHHVLPEFYLNGFSNSTGGLWVYDNKESQFRLQTPNNTTVIKHYYSLESADGEKDDCVEEMFSRVESAAKHAIDKLSKCESINKEERDALSIFAATMQTRVENYEKFYNNASESLSKFMLEAHFANEQIAASTLRQLAKNNSSVSEVTPKEMVEYVNNIDFVETHRNNSILGMVKLIPELAHCFAQMDWMILKTKNSSFITSDNPFVLRSTREMPPFVRAGIITPGAEKYLPLNSSACLVMREHGSRVAFYDVHRVLVRKVNLQTASTSGRFVISRDEPLLKQLITSCQFQNSQDELLNSD